MKPLARVGTYLKKEAGEIQSSVQGVVSDAKQSWQRQSADTVGKRLNSPPFIDPIKLRRIILTIIKVLIALEIIGAIAEGASTDNWSRFGFDLIIAGILYFMWERITVIAKQKKEAYRRKMESPSSQTKLWDAFVFSLLWTDEIYADFPDDRKRLVAISYTLITLGLIVAYLEIGTGLMALIVAGCLVLGAVNLLSWVVSRERGERETLQTELKLAHDVQVSLMPAHCPPVSGFDIAGKSLPAKVVGGDHFDFSHLGGGTTDFGISIFDVSGKGMHAAMSAVFTTGAFVSESRQASSPAEILTRLNKSVYKYSRRGHFVTFLLGLIDVAPKSFTFANAGQIKPLLCRDGTVEWLNANGATFPLGMTEDATYQERSIQLTPGSILLLMTDGFTEAMNIRDEQYGSERLDQFVKQLAASTLSAGQILEAITKEVQAFVGQAEQHDDMTMVVVKVE